MTRKFIGSKRMASGGATGRSSTSAKVKARRYPYLAICVDNQGNEASLQLGKAYQVIKPHPCDFAGRIRVIDEDGEDYLYLADWFVAVEVDPRGRRRVLEAVGA